jgi:hypothetical protein
MHANPTLMSTYERLVHELDLAGPEIDEVTTRASLSTKISPPIEEYSTFMRH